MMEERQDSDVKLNLKMAEKPLNREELLTLLTRVLDLAIRRLDNRYTTRSERQSWSRILISAIEAGNTIIKDSVQEELEERIEKIEEVINQVGKKD